MGCFKLDILENLEPKLTVISKNSTSEKVRIVDFLTTKKGVEDYYPFGMLARFGEIDETNYRFGFQSQESDDEVKGKGNTSSYKYRMSDNRLGRFFAADPLTVDYPHNSPYAFSENVVIHAIELEGLEKQIVTYGIKKSKKLDDDNFVKNCGSACATTMGLTPYGISSGKNLLSIMKSETSKGNSLSVYINFGHSWDHGLYLTDNNGFYSGNLSAGGTGSANLSNLKTMTASNEITTSKHSLYIFASCGTSGNGIGAVGKYSSSSFAATFGDYIDKSGSLPNEDYIGTYKVTTIGATGLSNLQEDGTIITDGSFIQTEKTYQITKTAVYETIPAPWYNPWGEETVFSHWDVETETTNTKTTNLGNRIDPAKIAKKHNDQDVQIK